MNAALSALIAKNRITPRRGLREWMESELTVPEGAYRGQLYRCDTRPWVAAVIPYLEQYRQIWIAACPRTGKSLLATGYGAWRLCEYGDSVQVLGPDEIITTEFLQDKLLRTLSDNERLGVLLPPKFGEKKTVDRRVPLTNGGVLRMRFNAANIRSYDASCLICTEASQFDDTGDEADVITLAQRRQDDHLGGLQVFESTHTRDTTRFAREVKAGTDSRLVCPCPHCCTMFEAGARQHMRFDEKHETAWIECPECKGEITEEHRDQMVSAVDVRHTNQDAKAFSVTVNWFHTKNSFQRVADAERAVSGGGDVEKIRDLFQNLYSMPVSLKDEEPEALSADKITKEMIIARIGGYKSGITPSECDFVIGAIDCQKLWLYWLVLGIGVDGSCWFVDWGTEQIVPYELQKTVVATPDMVLDTLDATYRKISEFNPLSVWVDTSYKSEASEIPIIRNWCAQRPGNVFAIAGRAGTEFDKMTQNFEMPLTVRDYVKPFMQDSGLTVWYLNTDRLKSSMHSKFLFPRGASGGVHFPSDTREKSSDALVRHMTGEEPIRKINRQGIEVVTWRAIKNRVDLWDCSIYAYAGGLLYSAIRKATPEPSPDQEVKREHVKQVRYDF